jgi:hypothetical protein
MLALRETLNVRVLDRFGLFNVIDQAGQTRPADDQHRGLVPAIGKHIRNLS